MTIIVAFLRFMSDTHCISRCTFVRPRHVIQHTSSFVLYNLLTIWIGRIWTKSTHIKSLSTFYLTGWISSRAACILCAIACIREGRHAEHIVIQCRDVKRWIQLEEACGLEGNRDVLSRHHWEIFRPWNMCRSKRNKDDDVLILDAVFAMIA